MRCAILPVFCSGTERQTSVSRAWLERVGGALQAYFDRQSGGRANMTFTAFEWRQIALTTEAWVKAGALVGRQVYESLADDGTLRRDEFDHFVILIDDQDSSGGVTPNEAPETSIIAAAGVTPTLIAHELGHRLKVGHTYREGPDGPIAYGGPFCVMGGEGDKHDFYDPSLDVPSEGASDINARSGPGMCFANLVTAGWADPFYHALRLRPFASGTLSASIELGALDGAPAPGATGLPVACVMELEDWYIAEYRSPTSAYDREVANNIPPRRGTLVLYRSPAHSPLVPLQVATAEVLPGSTLSLGDPAFNAALEKIGGVPGTPLQLTVTHVDPGGKMVGLRIERRLGKPPLYERTEDLLDFLQWAVVGRDFGERGKEGVLPLLKSLAEIQHLSRLQRIGPPRDRPALEQALQLRIEELQGQARNIRL